MGYKFNPFTGNFDTTDSPNGVFDSVEVNGDINLDDGGTYATTLQLITPTANRTISFPDATGTVALVGGSSGQLVYNNAGAYAGAPSTSVGATGDITLSLAGAASTPPVSLTGTWFSGGTSTTTKPQLLIEPNGTTSTAWSTSGTGLGVNAASGFGGRLLDLQLNGTSNFNVDSTGRVSFPLGTAALPSLYPGTDTNTGFYSPGADQLALSTNGTGRLFVDASGRVGIGTSAPDSPLQVIGSTSAHFKRTDNGTSAILITGNDKQWSLGVHSDDYFRITREGVGERLRITSAGLVGIGNSAPGDTLDVRAANGAGITVGRINPTGTNSEPGYFRVRGPNASSVDKTWMEILPIIADATNNSEDASIVFRNIKGGSNTESVRIDSSGRVGIGTTSPSNTLHISKEANHGITLERTTTNPGGFTLNVNSFGTGAILATSNVELTYASGANFRVFNGSTEVGRFDGSGRLLVGTSSSSDLASIVLEGYAGGGANAPSIAWFKRKEIASTITAGDGLGLIRFGSSDSGFGAEIAAQADAVWSSTADAPTRLVFSVTADGSASPTEALRITNDRYVRLASGTGGIQFNGDTAAANALDDYEEGTFTPTIAGTTSTGTATYTTQVGKYTKIGNTVVVTCRLDWSLHTGTGSIYIAGLPFTPAGTNALGSIFCGSLTFTDGITARILTGQTRVYPYSLNSGGAATLVNIVAAGGLDVTCTYYVS